MNRKFLIIDASHMLFRARMVATQGDIWLRTGLSLHLLFNIIKKCWRKFDADHVVFTLEGRSWRRSLYEPYKKNRDVLKGQKTIDEIEEDQIFYAAVNDFFTFIQDKTNCTVLQNPICESDDLVARWVQTHPDDTHVIVSGDTDFIQLLAPNISIYHGIDDRHITHEAVFDEKGNPLEFTVKRNSKLKIGEKIKPGSDWQPEADWFEFAKFIKIIGGDSGDNIFSIYPGIQLKRLRKIFEDRHSKAYEWNNFMLERKTDHNGNDYRIRDAYETNEMLIDLSKQPDPVKTSMDQTIQEATENPKDKKQIGLQLLKFAGKYELQKLSESPSDYTDYLGARYSKD